MIILAWILWIAFICNCIASSTFKQPNQEWPAGKIVSLTFGAIGQVVALTLATWILLGGKP